VSRRALGGVDHQQKLHEVVGVGEGRLHQVNLAAADRLFERYFKFSVGEVLDVHLAQLHAEAFADFFTHVARLCAGENLDGVDD
jgi:hypothetical protein